MINQKLNPFKTEVQNNLASPAYFMKKEMYHNFKMRGNFLKIEAVFEITKKAYQ